MKSLLSLIALSLFTVGLTFSQSGCTTGGVYAVPGPAVYRAPVPVYRAPARHAYYGGGYYRGYHRNYHSSGSYNGWRGGSASWGGGSGSWSGPRGGSGHWHR